MRTMQQLRTDAKALGINSFGMSKVDLQRAVDAAGDQAVQEARPDRAPRPETREDPAPRRRRGPLGMPQTKLAYPPIEGFATRWINDSPGRLAFAQDHGWEFVTEDHDGRDTRVGRRVGVNEDGSPMMAFLMKLRREFFEEDKAAKQVPLDEFDAQLRAGTAGTNEVADRSQYYTPREGTSISTD